ncbi:MAG: hypothetical protein ACPL4K_03315 [Candidatus Margulisiibacteriota bacterium]
MKKILTFTLVISLGTLLLSGCQTAQQPTSTPPISKESAASSLGLLASTGISIDNTLFGAVGVAGVTTQTLTTYPTPEYGADGWWHTTFAYRTDSTIEAYFRLWKVGNVEIVNLADLENLKLADVDKLSMYTTYTIGPSVVMKFGESKSNPLTFTGVGSNSTLTKSIDGPISFSGIDEDNTSYSIIIDYDNVSLSAYGIPNGNVSFSLLTGGTEVIAGNIAFDGTETATVNFSKGYSGSYRVNLPTGSVTPTS